MEKHKILQKSPVPFPGSTASERCPIYPFLYLYTRFLLLLSFSLITLMLHLFVTHTRRQHTGAELGCRRSFQTACTTWSSHSSEGGSGTKTDSWLHKYRCGRDSRGEVEVPLNAQVTGVSRPTHTFLAVTGLQGKFSFPVWCCPPHWLSLAQFFWFPRFEVTRLFVCLFTCPSILSTGH